nr:MAG TPA: hypothetical protein [Caudoviricetes sp.]
MDLRDEGITSSFQIIPKHKFKRPGILLPGFVLQ